MHPPAQYRHCEKPKPGVGDEAIQAIAQAVETSLWIAASHRPQAGGAPRNDATVAGT